MFHPAGMARYSLESINEYARRGYAVRVTCRSCGHATDWNAISLMRELHRLRASMQVDDVGARMRCSSCSQRGATISPAAGEW